ncbi:hypothetical protein [Actinacidiphila oryziradicis]|uniref:Uncharacterized protein n=1 Tax=Actinacidiphila oryziradicis TaxID=2571141 RepID=A0A4U0RZ57_9ACTN|nr:hypothetical protein [Actinacidiphila oryziradicis]TKA01700.1 hypothetical protein FCI23_40190 [Actinacidiphila oryziradicis]
MKTLPHPHTREGAAMLGVFMLVAVELVALSAAPVRDWAVVGGALAGGAASVFIVLAALWHGRSGPAVRHARPAPPRGAGEEWFAAQALEGFPMQAVRPLLLGPNAPPVGRLYTAWVFAAYGHDVVWIERNLDLPGEVARVLVEAARQRR